MALSGQELFKKLHDYRRGQYEKLTD